MALGINYIYSKVLSRRDRKDMLAHMQACWRAWESTPAGVYHLKEDAARLGQPGREYSHLSMSLLGLESAAFLPPQDPRVVYVTSLMRRTYAIVGGPGCRFRADVCMRFLRVQ